jgi:hypothetical protein
MNDPEMVKGAIEDDQMEVYHFYCDHDHKGTPHGDVRDRISLLGQTFGQAETTARGPVYAVTEHKGTESSRTYISLTPLSSEFQYKLGRSVRRMERYVIEWTYWDSRVLFVKMLNECRNPEGRNFSGYITLKDALVSRGLQGPLSEDHSVSYKRSPYD